MLKQPNVISLIDRTSRIDCTTTPTVQGAWSMSSTGNKRRGARSTDITVVVVRPATPNSDVLDNVYQILAAAKTA
jgi:hypothetical protein